MAGFTVGNTNIFTSNTFSATFNGLTVNNQLVFEDAGSHFQGSVSGFSSGGYNPTTGYIVDIDKFPFTSDTNATDVGSLSVGRYSQGGQSSQENGYTSAGRISPGASSSDIEKFPFAISGGTATDIGNLTVASRAKSPSSSTTHGYNAGGPSSTNVIDKFSFASDGNAVDVGDLVEGLNTEAGHTSSTSGYVSGGETSAPNTTTTIQKYPFATDSNSSEVGSLAVALVSRTGQSSEINGYASAGQSPAIATPGSSFIDRFPFASDIDATIVGDVSEVRYRMSGQSSTTSGYNSGGLSPGLSPSERTTIDKYPFASENFVASDVGDISDANGSFGPAGQQV